MQGKIMKGVGGFYYIHPHNTVNTIYECKAKGAFRNQKIKPAVGDDVEIEIISEQDKTGNIVEILPRENLLIRPAASASFASRISIIAFPPCDRSYIPDHSSI